MRRLVLCLSVVTFLSVGCKKTEEESPKGAGSASPVASAVAAAGGGDLASFLKDENAPLTPEIEEALLLSLKDCKVTDDGIDGSCEELKTYHKARGRKTVVKQVLGGTSSVGAKHIGHASPAVRYKAADLMSSFFGADTTTQTKMIAAAKIEKVPGVLANMLQAVGSKHAGNEEIKKLLMDGADHPSERVRIESMGWFLTSFGKDVPGTFEKATEKLDKDPSVKVRKFLCSRLYGGANEKAIPYFEKYLTDKKTPDELFAGCWEGVINAWTGFPKPDKPNQKAYELTMKVLEATPRTKERPPWTSISTLRASQTEFKADDSFGNAWFAKVKGWYKKDRMQKGLESLIVDSNAAWIGRASAVDVLKEIGTPKATFERMSKKIGDKGEDSLVKKKVDETIAKL